MDTTNGLNGGNWTKVNSFTDTGGLQKVFNQRDMPVAVKLVLIFQSKSELISSMEHC